MNPRSMLRSALFLAFLAAPLAAQKTIKLKSGAVVKGRATAYDSKDEVLSFHTEDGKDVKYTMDQLDEFQARNYGRDVFDYYKKYEPLGGWASRTN